MGNITTDGAMLQAIDHLTSEVLTIAYMLVSFTAIFQLVIPTLNRWMSGQGLFDLKALFYLVIVFGLLSSYMPLLGMVDAVIGAITQGLVGQENITEQLGKLGGGITPDDEDNILNEVTDVLPSFNLSKMLVDFLAGGILIGVRYLIELYRQFLLGFYTAVGPIALALSLINGRLFGIQVAITWFKRWFAVQCWSISIVIFDRLVGLYASYYHIPSMESSNIGEVGMAELHYLVVGLVVILLYLSIPKLTSMFVGAAAGSSGMSGVVQTIQNYAMTAVSAGSSTVVKGVQQAGKYTSNRLK